MDAVIIIFRILEKKLKKLKVLEASLALLVNEIFTRKIRELNNLSARGRGGEGRTEHLFYLFKLPS